MKKDELIAKQKELNPIDVLKESKKSIDRYVKRLDDNGCKGQFVNDYKKYQKEFECAIVYLEKEIEQEPIGEIEHGIPFKCPECGELIQYGLSEEGQKIIAKSRLFNNKQEPVSPYEGRTVIRSDSPLYRELDKTAEEILARCCGHGKLDEYDRIRKPWALQAMEEYARQSQINLREELSPRIAKLIIQIRDLIVEKEENIIDEIWHLLYQIASPNYDKLIDDVWSELERIANKQKDK